MHKGFLRTAAIFGALSVMLGAFGAHYLRDVLQVSERAVSTFETGARYQFYHVFALLAVGILYKEFASSLLLWAGRFFILGIILFSVSLYILALLQASVSPDYKWLGMVTPFGGLAFVAGWLLLFFSLFRKN